MTVAKDFIKGYCFGSGLESLTDDQVDVLIEAVTESLASGLLSPKDLGMIQASGVIGVVFSNGLVGATSDPKLAAQHGEPVPLFAAP